MAVAFQPGAFQPGAFQTGDTSGWPTETVKIDDGGRVDLRGLGNPVKVTDGPISAQLVSSGGIFVATSEVVKVEDVVTPTLNPERATIAEAAKAADVASAALFPGPELNRSLNNENAKLDEGGRVELRGLGNPVKIVDGPIVAVLGTVGDLTASKIEAVKLRDTVVATIGIITASISESLKLGESGEVELSRDEQIRVADGPVVAQRVTGGTVTLSTSRSESSVISDILLASREDPISSGGDPPISSSSVILTIGGTELAYHLSTLNIRQQTNGRNTLGVEIISLNTAFRPAWNDEIILTKDGVRIFGGYIEDFEETGVGGESASPHMQYQVSAVDNNSLPDRRYVNGVLPAGTLKSQLQVLEPYLTPYGVILSPDQADGPTLPGMLCPYMLLTDILNRLCELCVASMSQAVVWEIDYYKVLRVYGVLDGSHTAPFGITDENASSRIIGDILVKPTKTDFANGILVVYGQGEREIIDPIAGGDGVTTTFSVHLTPIATHGYINVGGLAFDDVIVGGTNESVGLAGEGMTWIFDPLANTITRTTGAPAIGQNVLFPYNARYPGLVSSYASVPSSQLVERLYQQPEIFDVTIAQNLAHALRVKASVELKEIEYETHSSGLLPGQIQSIVITKHNVSGIHVITAVDIADVKETVFTYRVRAVSGSDALPESWMQTYQVWSRGSSSVGGSSTGTIFAGTPMRPAYFLGGNDALYKQSPTPTWVPVDAVRVVIDTNIRQSNTGVAYVRLRASSGTVQARLWNVTDGTVAGTSAVVSSTSWTDADFAVTLATGSKVYELQVLPSLANVDVAGIGTFI
jgi:hypothetical protein